MWTDCKVTAVEINPDIAAVYKELYPKDEVIVGDAHDYLLKHFHKFDFIWSSPPCQSHTNLIICSIARHERYRKYPDMSLYQEVIFLNQFCRSLWIVENVNPYYDPLIKPTQSFGRHLFWSNFGFAVTKIPSKKDLTLMSIPELEKYTMTQLPNRNFSEDKKKNALIRRQILRNCVHPLMGQQIFSTAKRVWERRQSNKEKGIPTPKPMGFGF